MYVYIYIYLIPLAVRDQNLAIAQGPVDGGVFVPDEEAVGEVPSGRSFRDRCFGARRVSVRKVEERPDLLYIYIYIYIYTTAIYTRLTRLLAEGRRAVRSPAHMVSSAWDGRLWTA
jgi:hypothetical protein